MAYHYMYLYWLRSIPLHVFVLVMYHTITCICTGYVAYHYMYLYWLRGISLHVFVLVMYHTITCICTGYVAYHYMYLYWLRSISLHVFVLHHYTHVKDNLQQVRWCRLVAIQKFSTLSCMTI